MQKKAFFLFVISVLWSSSVFAQLRGGVKIGLNAANMSAPSELNTDGANIETYNTLLGFHIGPVFTYKITDYFGLRGELIYSRRGTKYAYDGPGFRNFAWSSGQGVSETTGNARYQLLVNNSYIDLPLTAYARLGNFEVHGGGYASALLQSVADGSLVYSSTQLNKDAEFTLRYNYLRDEPGAGVEGATAIEGLSAGARQLNVPNALGAYYDLPADRQDNLYKGLDYGLTGGISYYFNSALYLSGRIQYGLADITRTEADFSKVKKDNGALIYLDDNDRNFTWQVSIGFGF